MNYLLFSLIKLFIKIFLKNISFYYFFIQTFFISFTKNKLIKFQTLFNILL